MCEFGLDVFGYTPTQTTLAHPSPPHVARLKPFTEQSLHPLFRKIIFPHTYEKQPLAFNEHGY
jgi:hypothetical protein